MDLGGGLLPTLLNPSVPNHGHLTIPQSLGLCDLCSGQGWGWAGALQPCNHKPQLFWAAFWYLLPLALHPLGPGVWDRPTFLQAVVWPGNMRPHARVSLCRRLGACKIRGPR